MKRFLWYYRRLKKMSLREFFDRLLELLKIYIDLSLLKLKLAPYRKITFEHLTAINIRNIFTVNANKSTKFSKELDFSNFQILHHQFFKNINYREGNPHGDFREYWSKNRFDEVYENQLNNKNDYKKFKKFFLTWVKNNPPLYGPNYISVMECSIRSLNLLVFCAFNYKELIQDKKLSLAISEFISHNDRIIGNRISSNSSLGNHTLHEYSGLIALAVLMNDQNLIHIRCKNFIHHFMIQCFPDGGGIEQSTGYHYTNIQLATFVYQITKNNFNWPTEFIQRLASARKFMSKFIVDGRVIRFGDWDNGLLFNDQLMIGLDKLDYNELTNFRDSGYICSVKDDFKVIFKYGNLGMPPLFGHGHCNPLSINISDDAGLLTYDSSTYSYINNPELRKFFRSSAAQNMPLRYLKEKTVQESLFSWSSDYQSDLISFFQFDDADIFSAETNVFSGSKINRTVIHKKEFLVIIDECSSDEFSSNWHLMDTRLSEVKFYQFSKSEFNLKSLTPEIKKTFYSKAYGILSKSEIYKMDANSLRNVTLFSKKPITDQQLIETINIADEQIKKNKTSNHL